MLARSAGARNVLTTVPMIPDYRIIVVTRSCSADRGFTAIRSSNTGGFISLVKFTRRQPRIAFSTLPVMGGVSTLDDVENGMRRFIESGDLSAFDGGSMTQPIGWMPAMEISESANELTLTAELPGMDHKDVDLSMDDGVLNVRGEKVEERKEGEEGKSFYLSERSYGSFQRSFTLPRSVDAGKVTADFTKG